MNSSDERIVTHDFPVWRDRADFVIRLNLDLPEIADLATSEQLWARKVGDDIFEVCCIPFFAYGLALGDLVQTRNDPQAEYLVDKVLERKGHTTYRISFQSTDEWRSTIDELRDLGCFVEVRWENSKIVAVDAPSEQIRIKLEAYLIELESNGKVKCEIGN
jgi:Domain of unknown function (DUF4265)